MVVARNWGVSIDTFDLVAMTIVLAACGGLATWLGLTPKRLAAVLEKWLNTRDQIRVPLAFCALMAGFSNEGVLRLVAFTCVLFYIWPYRDCIPLATARYSWRVASRFAVLSFAIGIVFGILGTMI